MFFENIVLVVILNPAEIESEIKVSNEKGRGKKSEKELHKYH